MRSTPSFFARAMCACRIVLLGMTLSGSLALAQPAPDAAAIDTTLDTLQRQLATTQRALRNADDLDDAQLQALSGTALAAEAQANDIATQLAPGLAAIDARIGQLGTPVPGVKEDADVTAQRAQLARARGASDSQLKLARLLAIESQQLVGQLGMLRRSEFQARLGEHTASILSARFWTTLADDFPDDLAKLRTLGGELGGAAERTPVDVRIAAPLLAAAACWLMWWASHLLMRWLKTRAPAGRLRRSLDALVIVVGWTMSFGLVAVALHAVIDWHQTLPVVTSALLSNFVVTLWFAGFVYGLMKALICAGRPSWRLLPIPDPVAARLAAFPWLITLTSFPGWVVERLGVRLNASLSLNVAANCVVALAMGATIGVTLIRGERRWRRERAATPGIPGRPLWLAITGIAIWVVLGVAMIALLTGYVAFGSFVIKQVIWSGIVAAATYLLATLVDDLLTTWAATAPAAAPGNDAPHAAPATATSRAPRINAQVAVLASGLLRFALGLVALMLLLAPFGESPAELLRRGGQWQQSLSIGEFKLRPGAVLQALGVLLVGLGLVRMLRRWLTERYLPTTSLDAGMQSSATSLFGYFGVILAVASALSAMGIGLERIAWVASALSVGIGFGLQAVVQNFVSGLILLAERPVKVGDWVSLGGVEGDIRRINVRATEIQQGDRSTVIVPNSEFITKTVRNVTLANPLGLVQLKLPLPLTSDAEKVRTLLLEILAADAELVADPAPSVALEGIDGGSLVFSATGYVDSPRKTYNVRSAILFEVLKRFAAADIALAAPPTMLLGNLAAVPPGAAAGIVANGAAGAA